MRRFALIFGIFAVALAVVLLTAPWWLGGVLPRIGSAFGVTFKDYERVGYSRFILRDLAVRRDPVRVTVEWVEADTPLFWLWKRWTSAPDRVVAGTWRTDVGRSSKPGAGTGERGWLPLQRTLNRVADLLARWVPEVEAGSGIVTWPGQELTFASARWKDRAASSPDVGFRSIHASAAVKFSSNQTVDGTLSSLDQSGQVTVRSEGARMTASGSWWNQPARFSARFAEQGWLPLEASLQAPNWEVAGDRVKLGRQYAVVRANLTAEWREGRLSTDVTVAGEPLNNSRVPPLNVKLQGQITREAFTAELLQVSLPGIEAQLSAPVAIDRNGQLRSAPSTFTLNADLSQQPWFPAGGSLSGTGQISAGEGGMVLISFAIGGDDVALAETAISQLRTSGQLAWPTLTIQNARVSGPDGSELTAAGGWNLQSREILDVVVKGRLGRALLARWLPEYPKFDSVQLEAEAAGPWASVIHSGRAEMKELQFKPTHPLALHLTWNGRGNVIEKFVGEVAGGQSKIDFEGEWDASRLLLTAFTFANGETTRLQLQRPAELRWGETTQLRDLNLAGPDARLSGAFSWGEAGDFAVHAENLESEWLRELLVFPTTKLKVDQFQAEGRWNAGPAVFSSRAEVTVELGYNRAAQILAEITGSGEGLQIAALRVAEGGAVIATATGRVPVLVLPAAVQKWDLAADKPFMLEASTSANPAFWEEVNRLTGINVVQPEATVHFDGTLNQPRGEARFTATQIAPEEGRYKGVWPKLENLDVHVTGDRDGLTLDQFAVAIEGQALRIQGRIPVAAGEWRALLREPRTFVERGEIHLLVPDAEIAPFVQYFPAYIAPYGRFQVDLRLNGEKSVVGFIRVQDGSSRPLGPLGVLQEINADIQFTDRTANFHAVTARMAGQLVTLQGTAELPVRKPPQLDLTLKGENLPFIRRAGLLVRGDLDLKLLTPDSGVPALSGVVRLRDSLFLADIRSLLPGGTRGVAARPPYFSLETPPLNTWTLDVGIEGERFLRLRTPVFSGIATARFRLDGTLGEPRIAGEALVDQGSISLPFANFAVQQGEVRLSVGQVEPQIWVTATTRRFGYDIRMELSGNTSAPNLTFTSSPPLEAEQVLLMVMAGEAPRDEVTSTDRQRVARFGAFFGQTLLGTLRGDTGGADRLTISSGGDISEQGRETYSIEYKLDDRWALTGEYDEFDDYYGGLKWRIYPRAEKKADEKK